MSLGVDCRMPLLPRCKASVAVVRGVATCDPEVQTLVDVPWCAALIVVS